MPPHKGSPSLTDSERFSSDGSNESLQVKKRLPSSRRRVGIADDLRSSTKSSSRKGTSFHEPAHTSSHTSSRKATSFYDERASNNDLKAKNKSFDDRASSRQQQQQRRPSRKYIQESPEPKKDEPRRRYIQESSETTAVSTRQHKERRQSSSLRGSNTKPSSFRAESKAKAELKASEEQMTTDLAALITENRALEAERATIEKYKKMYEAILQDPSNAFLFEGSVCGDAASAANNGDDSPGGKSKDTFDAALNVEELIEGLKLKDLLHDSATAMGSSESVSILSEIRQGDKTGVIERYRPKSKRVAGSGVGSIKEERTSSVRSRDDVKSRSKSQHDEGERRPRSSSKGALTSSIKSESKSAALDTSNRSESKGGGLDSSDRSEQQRRPKSGSKGRLSSSMRSHSSKSATLDNSDRSYEPVPQRRKSRRQSQDPNRSSTRSHSFKSATLDNSDFSDEPVPQRRKSRRQSQDPNLTSSGTSQKSSRSRHEDEKDCVSVTSNTSTGSRMGRFFGRFSFSSNADRSVADESDYDNMTDVEDDVVPDLNSVNYEKKEKKGLFRTMKKFGKKVTKAFNSGPGFKKYKVGEVARYNIGKIRDSLESFDPQDPTVEVVIVAVHIDAVLEIPYYTIQLPDGSRKQTNMENLIPLEDYNNGSRPYSRIKEKRSSSRRRSRGDDDDDSVSSSRSNRSTRSTQSNRSTRSSSSRRSSRHHEHSESPERDDRSVCSSSSRHRSSSRHKDRDYRPKVDAMRGGGMAAPNKGIHLKKAEKQKSKADSNDSDDDEPVIIKLTSRNSAGSSFALDAAVAAAVGVRRASASVCSASRSVGGASVASNTHNKSYSSLPVSPGSRSSRPPSVVELSPQKSKPPSVVELSPKKASAKPPAAIELSPTKKSKPIDVVRLSPKKKSSPKPPVIVEMPNKMIRHANTMDDATMRGSRCGSSCEQRRSRSTGPSKPKAYPKGTCSKCDGCHKAVDCPIYPKDREQHKDSWRYYGDNEKKQMGEDGGNKRVKAKRIKQPADGSCLFHSLAFCFNSMRDRRMSSCASISSSSTSVSSCVPPPLTAKHLRKKIANYIAANPNLNIADDQLKEWVMWDSGKSVKEYASAMAVGGWGGGIEIAACSQLYKVNIHIYESDPKSNEFVRISCFNLDSKTKKTLHLLYHGRNHYDALQLK